MGMIFMLCGIAAAVFTLYMILCRPEQYAQLMKAEEERKQAAEARSQQRAERLGKAAKGAMEFAEKVLKKK